MGRIKTTLRYGESSDSLIPAPSPVKRTAAMVSSRVSQRAGRSRPSSSPQAPVFLCGSDVCCVWRGQEGKLTPAGEEPWVILGERRGCTAARPSASHRSTVHTCDKHTHARAGGREWGGPGVVNREGHLFVCRDRSAYCSSADMWVISTNQVVIYEKRHKCCGGGGGGWFCKISATLIVTSKAELCSRITGRATDSPANISLIFGPLAEWNNQYDEDISLLQEGKWVLLLCGWTVTLSSYSATEMPTIQLEVNKHAM